MDGGRIKLYRKVSIAFIAITVIIALLVTFVTYIHQDMTSVDPLIFWTVENHLSITIGLILFSLILGYIISALTYNELRKTKRTSKKLLETLFVFLNREEREIINFLVKSTGIANQADISRLPGMNRVKAFRSLQKMKDNNLIEISSHGKIRKISLKNNVFDMLVSPES